MSQKQNFGAGRDGQAAGGAWKIILPWGLFAITAVAFVIYAVMQANQPNVSKGEVGEEAVATIDGEAITANEVYQLMLDTVGPQAVEQLILEKLVGREAAKQNIVVTEADIDAELDKIKADYADEATFLSMLEMYGYTLDKLKDQLESQILLTKLIEPEIEVTDEEMQEYYDANQAQFVTTPGEVKASHILVDTKEEADSLLAELKAGADFAELAKEHSKDPGSAEQGGDLGFFGRGEMVPAFENAAFALEIGELSEVVESDYGFHIIKVTDKKEEVVKPFEESKEEVRELLFRQKVQERSSSYLEELKTAAKIENALDTGEQASF